MNLKSDYLQGKVMAVIKHFHQVIVRTAYRIEFCLLVDRLYNEVIVRYMNCGFMLREGRRDGEDKQ